VAPDAVPEATAEPQTPQVEVRLLGLPEGALATFAGRTIEDATVRGPRGMTGKLEVAGTSFERLDLRLTLEQDGEVDLSAVLTTVDLPRRRYLRPRPRRAPVEGPRQRDDGIGSISNVADPWAGSDLR